MAARCPGLLGGEAWLNRKGLVAKESVQLALRIPLAGLPGCHTTSRPVGLAALHGDMRIGTYDFTLSAGHRK